MKRRNIMIKTTIKETTEKFDENGKLVEKITREETSEDNTVYNTPVYPYNPWSVTCDSTKVIQPTCTITSDTQ
jgi:hypothetical protein